jgi:hypothetical protein
MDFKPGGKYLPYDWVDEGKLLRFIKTEVAERAPRKGSRLTAERKRKAQDGEGGSKGKRRKRRSQEAEKASGAPAGEPQASDGEAESELTLKYNSVRAYVSAIMELWHDQVTQQVHCSPTPHNVAVKVLQSTIARGQHQRRREEFEDWGENTIKDGYTAEQVPDMTRAAWRGDLGPRTAEQAFRTNLDFLLGHSMLLRQGNRLAFKLPVLFTMDLPKGEQRGQGWCFVVVMYQGRLFPLTAWFYFYIYFNFFFSPSLLLPPSLSSGEGLEGRGFVI